MSEIVTTAADQVIVDLAKVPSQFAFNKNLALGVVAGTLVGAGAVVAAGKLKEYRARKNAIAVKAVDTK